MALFPCAIDAHRYAGRQSTFYFAVSSGLYFDRTRLRLCPDHFASIQDYLSEFKLDPLDDTASGPGVGTKCVSCLKPLGESRRMFFATGYPANQEREDYWGCLHDHCELPPDLRGYDSPHAPDPVQRPEGPRKPDPSPRPARGPGRPRSAI